jgi:hypothetical protein
MQASMPLLEAAIKGGHASMLPISTPRAMLTSMAQTISKPAATAFVARSRSVSARRMHPCSRSQPVPTEAFRLGSLRLRAPTRRAADREQATQDDTADALADDDIRSNQAKTIVRGQSRAKFSAQCVSPEKTKPTCAAVFEAPRVGLEPTTLRLTAGCSAN